MTRCGIGPLFTIPAVLYGTAAGVLTFLFPDILAIRCLPYPLLAAAGAVLLAAGLTVYLVSFRQFNAAYREGRLATTGMFAVVRHPIYAAWILLIFSGGALLTASWPMLGVPAVAWIVFRISIHREERYLEETFGGDYRAFRSRVNALIPFPRTSVNRKTAADTRIDDVGSPEHGGEEQ